MISRYVYICIIVICSSCIVLDTGQTGRTSGKDFFEAISHFGVIYDFDSKNNVSAPMGSLGVSLGLADNIDLSISAGFIAAQTAIKYQFVGDLDSDFAMSTRAFVGFINGISDPQLTAGVGLPFSYHFKNSFAIYINPAYRYAGVSDRTFENDYFNKKENHFVTGFGIKYGNRKSFFADYSFSNYFDVGTKGVSGFTISGGKNFQFISVGVAYKFYK